MSNVSTVHGWLVDNSYLLLLLKHEKDHEKCLSTYLCSMGIPYGANSMQYMLLNVILFML